MRGSRAGFRRVAVWAVFSMVAVGCAGTRVTGSSPLPEGPLPKPDVVYVHEFHILPAHVILDSAPGERLEREFDDEDTEQLRQEAAAAASRTLADALVSDVRKLGLDARLGDGRLPPPDGEALLSVQGQILSIDEGNRLRRLAIGLGAGGSKILASVQLYLIDDSGERLVQRFDVVAKSPPLPGAAETMGAGAAVGSLAVAGAVTGGTRVAGLVDTKLGQTVRADATRAAEVVAEKLEAVFRAEGWIAGP